MSYLHQSQKMPLLKNGVDMQLQSAFAEQKWTTVIRLAEKRLKISKDEYYEALKAVAESRLDGVSERAAVPALVDLWLRSNVTPDLEAIELLEWACKESLLNRDYEKTYSKTFGVLRTRWVQANTRNAAAATNCLRSCLQAWDLVNAQQIAAVLDKSFHKHDRRYMFWAILLTHLLAGDTSQAASKRKIYGMLAQKQLEKAARAAEENGIDASGKYHSDVNDRNLRNEEEFLLYLRVLAAHGTPANYAQRILDQKAGAAVQLAVAGRKQLLDEVLSQLQLYRQWDAVFEFFFTHEIVPKLDKDPRIDLSLVAVSVFIRLNRYLSAALVLDTQHRLTPDDIPVRLLLIRLSLRIGCSTHALALWQPLGVKRSILDALGPIFFDRLSTFAPGLFVGDLGAGRGNLLQPIKHYFDTVMRQPSAVRIWDAFASGSYASILDMEMYHTRLQQSATRAMAILENRRASRAIGGRIDPVPDDLPATSLHDSTDYGAFPNLETSFGLCLAEQVCIGPGFSRSGANGAVRLQLGVLTERYLDIITFKPPKEYKPSKPAEAVERDRAFVAESLARLDEDIHRLLHKTADLRAQLTSAEWAYYLTVSALTGYTSMALDSVMPPSIYVILEQSLSASVELIKKKALSASPLTSINTLLIAISNLHSVGMLREAAIAIRCTALFLAAHHDRESIRDRSCMSGLSREALAGVERFRLLATQTLVDIKTYLKAIKVALSQNGLLANLRDEVRQGELGRALGNVVDNAAIIDWADHTLSGWRATMQGWMPVQMD
ncbi:hypothetical protein SEPCBS119000_005346 [Sporothrix epigloea]|uniref:Uncharacterized protein n=1 Tax=Sporothrix epigloea TaxID=1892477 RepID=A0ABP0E104_9PEZI